MALPRNMSSKNSNAKEKRLQRNKNTSKENSTKPLSQEELESLDDDVKRQFHKDYVLKDFQKAATQAQLQSKDTIVHAHTGAGKTAIVAAPHAHPKSKGKVTFLVSPLIALQDEQAEAFREEYHLSAIAINSSHGGLTAENMTDICSGKYQVVVISPEMMLTKRFTKLVIKNKALARRVLSIVIDEAHVISHWGSGFRKKYGELGILRTLLPSGLPFVALSATLPSRVRDDILTKLQFSRAPEGFVDINIGNDRPNVSLVARAMQHPMNTYKDLDFIIPANAKEAKDIPKTFIYSDNIPSGPDIVDHLESLLPKDLQGVGLVRPFSAIFSRKYRKAVMKQFKVGIIRVLVCTDAAGMGCNIPDIDIVVQWKLPDTLSMFIQRAGRAARARGRKGLAVLLVEKSAYGLDCEKMVYLSEEKGKGKGKGKGKVNSKRERTTGDYAKGTTKNFAQTRGVNRGSYGGKTDTHTRKDWEPSVDRWSKDEGLLVFVQTACCRRRILTQVYSNRTPECVPGVPCCDNCDPRLLDRTRPGKYKAPARATPITKGEPHKPTIKKLYEWRASVWKENHSLALWPASSLLSNDHAHLLASVGAITSFDRLKQIIGSHWAWWDKYGKSLWNVFEGLEIPGVQKPKKRKEREDVGKQKEAPPAKRRARRDDGSIESTVSMTAVSSINHTPHARALSTSTPTPIVASTVRMLPMTGLIDSRRRSTPASYHSDLRGYSTSQISDNHPRTSRPFIQAHGNTHSATSSDNFSQSNITPRPIQQPSSYHSHYLSPDTPSHSSSSPSQIYNSEHNLSTFPPTHGGYSSYPISGSSYSFPYSTPSRPIHSYMLPTPQQTPFQHPLHTHTNLLSSVAQSERQTGPHYAFDASGQPQNPQIDQFWGY